MPGPSRPQPHPATSSASDRRLALSKQEAADALGLSVDFLEDHILPDLRVVRVGRRRLIPITELEHWLDRNASRAIEP